MNRFKQLREGTNIGKVVIRLKSEPNIGTALITGGLGGLGLVTAELLFDIGAKHIVLVSRSGKAKNYDGQHLEDRLAKLLQLGNGACVSIECCDMSVEVEVKSLTSSTVMFCIQPSCSTPLASLQDFDHHSAWPSHFLRQELCAWRQCTGYRLRYRSEERRR